MKRKEFFWLAVIASVSGLVGGAVSSRVFSGAPALADSEMKSRGHVQAEGFELVDAEGNTRAELGFGARGTPNLLLLDRDYRVRAKIALAEDGTPCMDLRDTERRCRAKFMLGADGSPAILVEDENCTPRAGLGFFRPGEADLQVRDRAGRLTWSSHPDLKIAR